MIFQDEEDPSNYPQICTEDRQSVGEFELPGHMKGQVPTRDGKSRGEPSASSAWTLEAPPRLRPSELLDLGGRFRLERPLEPKLEPMPFRASTWLLQPEEKSRESRGVLRLEENEDDDEDGGGGRWLRRGFLSMRRELWSPSRLIWGMWPARPSLLLHYLYPLFPRPALTETCPQLTRSVTSCILLRCALKGIFFLGQKDLMERYILLVAPLITLFVIK